MIRWVELPETSALLLLQSDSILDLSNTTTPPLVENTSSAVTGNANEVQIQDINFFPMMQGVGVSSLELDMGTSILGGLVMNSDYEFINNYYQTVPRP
jgi:hypothetical protein